MRYLTYLLLGMVLVMSGTGCSTSRYYHLPSLEFDQIDYQYPIQTVKVRNLTVGMIDEGEGDALILVHGLGSNAKAWLRNIPAWSVDHRVIAVDLPGYGTSSKGDYPYSLPFYAQVLTDLMDELELTSATLVGHSLGGQIAMVTALEHPDRVGRLVLVSPAGFERFSEGEGQWFKDVMTVELVRDTPVRQIAVNLHANFHHTPPEAEFMITDRVQVRGASDFEDYCYAVTRNVAAMIDQPVHSRLDEIMVPTLILFGENDALIPNPYLHGGRTRDVATIGETEIPDSELVLIPGCGHFVQFEKPDETNAAVRGFLAR